MDHLNIKHAGLLPWRLVASTSGLMAGCTDQQKLPLTTLGQLPTFENINDKLESLNLKLPKPESNIDTKRLVDCMVPLTSRLQPGAVKALGQFQAELDPLQDLNAGNLLDKQSLIVDLLDKLTTSPQLEGAAELTQTIKAELAKRRNDFKARVTADSQALKTDSAQALKLETEYLTAYFKKGSAQRVQDPAEQTELRQQAASLLKLKTDDPRVDKVLDLVSKQLARSTGKLAPKSAGFVSRDGSQYGFPGILEPGSHASIDHSQINADILRVALEAVRDHYAPLPVLPNTTAAPHLKDYVVEFGKPLRWVYDRHTGHSATVTIDEEDFQEIEAHARKAEASVAGAVGKAIRGGSWGALNNEAVAKLVETAAGVVARHVSERAQWCLKAQTGEAHASQQ